MLLARMAEAVYWAGRYLERAECTARIVQVHTDTHVDLPVGVGPDLLGRGARVDGRVGGVLELLGHVPGVLGGKSVCLIDGAAHSLCRWRQDDASAVRGDDAPSLVARRSCSRAS